MIDVSVHDHYSHLAMLLMLLALTVLQFINYNGTQSLGNEASVSTTKASWEIFRNRLVQEASYLH